MSKPEAVKFVNEVLRPVCEEARALLSRVSALAVAWKPASALFGKPGERLEDGRDAEGVSRLTSEDVTLAVAQLLGLSADADAIQKPCVRLLP